MFNSNAGMEALLLASYQIGDIHPDGGIVFAVDDTGMHGMICAKQDLGKLGHEDAIAEAKKFAGGGWVAPLKRHLVAMYEELHEKRNMGNFEDDLYRSTEFVSAFYQRAINFGDGNEKSVGLNDKHYVRPVKAF